MMIFTVFCLAYLVNNNVSGQEAPKWPSAYVVKGVIYAPDAEISEPFDAWYDGNQGSSRIDYYNGTVKTYQLSKEGKYGTYFKVEPVLKSVKCFKVEGTREQKVRPQSVLPDMTGFQLKGEKTVRGVVAEMWQLVMVSGRISNMYLYWKSEASAKAIVPLRYEEFDTDHHYMDYNDFVAAPPPPSTFEIHNESCTPLSEFDGLEEQLVYSFNPIKEYVDHTDTHFHLAWETYKQKFSKTYSPDEDVKRKNVFRHKMRFITSTNRANLSYSLAVNHLADYTAEEFEALISCAFNSGNFGNKELYQDPDNETNDVNHFPKSWDWRTRGAVTPVKDQFLCGCCWSFSATGAMEGAHFLKTNHLVTLSEQVLLDCSWDYGNMGCNGGYTVGAFKWVIKNKGIPLQGAYGPYRAEDNYCHVNRSMASVKIKRYKRVKKVCPNCLKYALMQYGPIAVPVFVNEKLRFYNGGVFNDRNCPKSKKKANHSVLIVGFGTLYDQEYWLVKNSWSVSWGINGYALMAIKDNICGIMSEPIFVEA